MHDQAVARAYRLGQKKHVHVTFLDANMTIDQTMAFVNARKSENASILLGDFAEYLSKQRSGNAAIFKDIEGFFGSCINEMKSERARLRQEFGNNQQLPRYPEGKRADSHHGPPDMRQILANSNVAHNQLQVMASKSASTSEQSNAAISASSEQVNSLKTASASSEQLEHVASTSSEQPNKTDSASSEHHWLCKKCGKEVSAYLDHSERQDMF